MSAKLLSCLGYTLRLARRNDAPKVVTDHLLQALHFAKLQPSDDSMRPCPEPEAKRRRVLRLSDALSLAPSMSHDASSQTISSCIDAGELHTLLSEMGEKNSAMVQLQMQQFRKEIDAMLARKNKEHAEHLAAKDRQIAQLQQDLESILNMPDVPDPFLMLPELLRLHFASRFHFERYHFLLADLPQDFDCG
eukprot:Skav233544  [mRNA]  locus=scaffold1537:59681:60256:+ [translate_table: standard]